MHPQYLEFAPVGTTVYQIQELQKQHKNPEALKQAVAALWDGESCIVLTRMACEDCVCLGWTGYGVRCD